MSEETKFYETQVLIRILSDREVGEISGPESLIDILSQCDQGDYVGDLINASSKEITSAHMARLLLDAGSDPRFFDIDDRDETAYVCANCDYEAACDDMHDVVDVTQRFVPGDIYTDKQCPECHCLAYPKESNE